MSKRVIHFSLVVKQTLRHPYWKVSVLGPREAANGVVIPVRMTIPESMLRQSVDQVALDVPVPPAPELTAEPTR